MNLARLLDFWPFLLSVARALIVPHGDIGLTLTEPSLLPNRSSLINHPNQTWPHSDLPINRAAVFCDGEQYGRALVAADCRDAITGIPRKTQQIRFGKRSANPSTWDVGLPYRLIGVQGLCTVELEFKPGRSSAIATSLDISQAAIAVSRICVAGVGVNSGGVAIDIGGDNNLGVALASYKPHVQCIDGSIGPPGSIVPPLKSCDVIVGSMFATKDVISFGKQGSGASKIVPGVDTSPDLQCTIEIDTTTPIENASWYDIWAAAVAINGMCVRTGKTGKATDLGENGSLFVTMWGRRLASGGSVLTTNTTILGNPTGSEALEDSDSTI